jgi:hypothetical protein
MTESFVYSESDLRPFQSRLAELRQIVKDDAGNQPLAMIQLIERKLTQCGECFHSNPSRRNMYSRSFNRLLLLEISVRECSPLMRHCILGHMVPFVSRLVASWSTNLFSQIHVLKY